MAKIDLSDADKDHIVYAFTQGKMTQTALANHYEVHRRTIQRVLEERGVPPQWRAYDPDEQVLIDVGSIEGVRVRSLIKLLFQTLVSYLGLIDPPAVSIVDTRRLHAQ